MDEDIHLLLLTLKFYRLTFPREKKVDLETVYLQFSGFQCGLLS